MSRAKFKLSDVVDRLRSLAGEKDKVPTVHLQGVIASSGGPTTGPALNISALGPVLDKAFTTKGAVAVALIINSPGGSPTQSALIADRIVMLAAKHELPVLAFVEDVAASGGYWLACAANEIIAHETSTVGSIGVVSSNFGFERLIDKVGVDRRLRAAGTNKARLDPFSPESADDLAWLDEHLDALHQMFIAWVTERRAEHLDTDTDVFTGDVWTGAEARSLGLVDSLSTFHRTIDERYPDAKVVEISPPVPLLARLIGAARVGTPSLSQMLESAARSGDLGIRS